AEVGQRGPQDPDRAPERAVDRGLPGGLVELVEAAGWWATRVHDQQIEPAQGAHGHRDRVGRAIRRREVRWDGGRSECRRGLVEPGSGPGGKTALRPLGDQGGTDGAPEAAAPTTDEGPSPSQSKIHPDIVPARKEPGRAELAVPRRPAPVRTPG